MLLPGNYEANENNVEMYYVKVDLGVWIVTRYRNESGMSSCYILQKEMEGACLLVFTQFPALLPCIDTYAKYFA